MVKTNSLTTLRSNLIEMSLAEDLHRDLVASSNQKRVFGRTVKAFSSQSYFHLDGTLKKIKEIFWEHVGELQKQTKIFFEHLNAELRKEKYHPDEKDNAFAKILYFCMRMKPVMQDVIKDRIKPYLTFLLQKEKGERLDLKELFSVARFCQKMKDFELSSDDPLPLDLLFRASLGRNPKFKVKEKEKLQAWLNKVKAAAYKKIASFEGPIENSFVKVRFINKLLREITDYFNAEVVSEGQKSDLGCLELELLELGLEVFSIPDSKHITWRSRLEPGSIIDVNEDRLELGEILENEEREDHLPMIFAVKDDPSREVVIEPNGALSNLRYLEERCLHCGVPKAQVIAMEKYGAAYVRERLYSSLNFIHWRSLEWEIGTTYDKPRCQPLLQLINGFMNMPFTPYPLVPYAIAENVDKEFRATRMLIPALKSFEYLENFVRLLSQGDQDRVNPAVFSYLMRESGMRDMPEALVYQDLVRMACNNEERSKATSLNFTIVVQAIIDKRIEIFDRIVRLRDAIKEKILHSYKVKSKKQLDKDIALAVVSAHRHYCPGSFLLDIFEEQALEYTFITLQPELKDEFYRPHFERVYQELMQENKLDSDAFKHWKKRANHHAVGVYNVQQIDAILKKASLEILRIQNEARKAAERAAREAAERAAKEREREVKAAKEAAEKAAKEAAKEVAREALKEAAAAKRAAKEAAAAKKREEERRQEEMFKDTILIANKTFNELFPKRNKKKKKG